MAFERGLLIGEEAEKPVENEMGQHIRVLVHELGGIVDFIVHNDVEILSTHQIQSAPIIDLSNAWPRTFFPLCDCTSAYVSSFVSDMLGMYVS